MKNKHAFIQTEKAKSSHFDRTRGDKNQIYPTWCDVWKQKISNCYCSSELWDIYIPKLFTLLNWKDIYIPKLKKNLHPRKKKTFKFPRQIDIYIPEAKRCLHPQSKKDIYIPEAKRRLIPWRKKTFISPKKKDVYIPEAKRRLHPRSKKMFTSPKQKDVYISDTAADWIFLKIQVNLVNFLSCTFGRDWEKYSKNGLTFGCLAVFKSFSLRKADFGNVVQIYV